MTVVDVGLDFSGVSGMKETELFALSSVSRRWRLQLVEMFGGGGLAGVGYLISMLAYPDGSTLNVLQFVRSQLWMKCFLNKPSVDAVFLHMKLTRSVHLQLFWILDRYTLLRMKFHIPIMLP